MRVTFGISRLSLAVALIVHAALAATPAVAAHQSPGSSPKVSTAVAFDKSPALRDLPHAPKVSTRPSPQAGEIRAERGPNANNTKYLGDGALQTSASTATLQTTNTTLSPLGGFEGLNNHDNAALFRRRVHPPDPVGA